MVATSISFSLNITVAYSIRDFSDAPIEKLNWIVEEDEALFIRD